MTEQELKDILDKHPLWLVGGKGGVRANLPSPEETVTRTYLAKVGDAINYAHQNSIDDEYVTPLRNVTCAMTDNLLTGPEEKS